MCKKQKREESPAIIDDQGEIIDDRFSFYKGRISARRTFHIKAKIYKKLCSGPEKKSDILHLALKNLFKIPEVIRGDVLIHPSIDANHEIDPKANLWMEYDIDRRLKILKETKGFSRQILVNYALRLYFEE